MEAYRYKRVFLRLIMISKLQKKWLDSFFAFPYLTIIITFAVLFNNTLIFTHDQTNSDENKLFIIARCFPYFSMQRAFVSASERTAHKGGNKG